MSVQALRQAASRHGTGAAVSMLASRLVNRVIFAKVLCCLESPITGEVASSQHAGRYRCGLADVPELLAASADSTLELSAEFVQRAIAEGHECAGVFDGKRLIAYCWCAALETEIVPGVVACPPPGRVYVYKAFTRPSHRGEGLLGECIEVVRERARHGGLRGLVTVIESANVASIKAFTRAGFAGLGRAWVLGLRRSRWTWNDASCRRAGFLVLTSEACLRRAEGTRKA